MKNTFLILLVFGAFNMVAQLQPSKLSSRAVINEVPHRVPYTVAGNIMFEVAVNNKGEVTAVRVLRNESSISSMFIESQFIVRLKKELTFELSNDAPPFEYFKFNVVAYRSETVDDTSVYPSGYGDVLNKP